MEFLTSLADTLLPILGMVLMGLVPVFVGVIAHYVRKWTGVQISNKQRQQIEDLAYDAVAYAEEQAHKYYKANGGTEKLSSDDKMRAATDFVARQAIELDLPGMAIDALRDLVEARLGEGRNNEG